jgi:hypothetical protein
MSQAISWKDKALAWWMKARSKKWRFAIELPLLFLLIVFLFFALCYQETGYSGSTGFKSDEAMRVAVVLLLLFALGVIAYFTYMGIEKKLTAERLAFCFVLLSGAILLFFGGLRMMNDNVWKHDWSVYYNSGHWDVIYEIFNTGKWPDVSLVTQAYQPKFWHTTMVLFMKVMSWFMPIPSDNSVVSAAGTNFPLYTQYEYNLMESTRILIAFVGVLTLYLGYRIFKELPLKGPSLAIATFLLSFTPVFWYLPFYANNDSFALFFAFLALFFALRYRRLHSWADIIVTALAIGLGMESKLNAGLVAIPVAFIFLCELLRVYKKDPSHAFLLPKHERIAFWSQIAVFALIVFPLGLGYSIYAKLTFGEPIGYVMDLEHDLQGNYHENWMHIEESNPFLRFVAFPSPDLFFGTIWNMRGNGVWGKQDFNIWTAFLKTALWGEGTPAFQTTPVSYGLCSFIYYVAILLGVLFILSCLFFLVRAIHRRHLENPFLFILLGSFFLVQAISYAFFAYRYPVGCSMNARYAMLLFIPLYAILGEGLSQGFLALKKRFPSREESRHD